MLILFHASYTIGIRNTLREYVFVQIQIQIKSNLLKAEGPKWSLTLQ